VVFFMNVMNVMCDLISVSARLESSVQQWIANPDTFERAVRLAVVPHRSRATPRDANGIAEPLDPNPAAHAARAWGSAAGFGLDAV